MAKSIKLQDDTFLDSTGIVHNKELLSDILNGLGGGDSEGTNFTDINRADLNDFTSGVVIGYGHNLTNTPTSNLNVGHLISVPRHEAEGFVTQYFSPYSTNDVYLRKCEEGTWGKWILLTNNYTTAERCIGTYIDGKPLYRKVVNFGRLPNSSEASRTVNHGVSNIDTIVSVRGMASNSSGTAILLPFLSTVAANMIIITFNKTSIIISAEIDRSGFNGVVVMEYTKTTD